MTTSFVNSGNLILGANHASAPSTVGVVVTERTELFLDSGRVESVSGVSVTVNKPTKHGSNPLLETGVNSATWDNNKNSVSVQKVGSTFKFWYLGYEADGTGPYSCYATSADGITLAKPNLGIVTFDGDTDNNIFKDNIVPREYIVAVRYNPDGAADEKYIMAGNKDDAPPQAGPVVFKSADGTTGLTELVNIHRADGEGAGGHGIVQDEDGRWRVPYQVNWAVDSQRYAGFIRSDSATLTGSWSDNLGWIIDSNGANDQIYHAPMFLHHGNWIAFVGDFNASTDQMHTNLYFSRDGFSWAIVSDQWVPRGSGGSWDDEVIFLGDGLAHHNDDWYYYYIGGKEDHSVVDRDSRIGLATIGYERIGSIGTTGNLITDPIMPAADLHVNTDASGGTLKVELLNANDDSILDGFSQDDFDTISSDTYDTTCQWGGIGIPTNKEVKLKFYLSSATLYSYWVRS